MTCGSCGHLWKVITREALPLNCPQCGPLNVSSSAFVVSRLKSRSSGAYLRLSGKPLSYFLRNMTCRAKNPRLRKPAPRHLLKSGRNGRKNVPHRLRIRRLWSRKRTRTICAHSFTDWILKELGEETIRLKTELDLLRVFARRETRYRMPAQAFACEPLLE
jgi:hypothetical protein